MSSRQTSNCAGVCVCVCMQAHTHTHVRVCLVTHSGLNLCDPMDCSLPDSSVHGILQSRILERVSMSSPGDGSNPGSNPRLLYLLYCRRILYQLSHQESPYSR